MKKLTAKLSVPVPEAHLSQIGRITVNFGALENNLKYIIWDILGGQHLGQVVTADLTFKALVDQANALFGQNIRKKEFKDELWGILSGPVREAQVKRNQVIHASWGRRGSQQEIVIMNTVKASKKTGYHNQDYEMTADDLSEIADLIANAAYEVQQFRLKMRDSIKNV